MSKIKRGTTGIGVVIAFILAIVGFAPTASAASSSSTCREPWLRTATGTATWSYDGRAETVTAIRITGARNPIVPASTSGAYVTGVLTNGARTNTLRITGTATKNVRFGPASYRHMEFKTFSYDVLTGVEQAGCTLTVNIS